uniref:Uncharacterized protein n=1 Tax=Oryza meridionalis TaxID=40149 RepID=A0A0E0DU07_9ORYZ
MTRGSHFHAPHHHHTTTTTTTMPQRARRRRRRRWRLMESDRMPLQAGSIELAATIGGFLAPREGVKSVSLCRMVWG